MAVGKTFYLQKINSRLRCNMKTRSWCWDAGFLAIILGIVLMVVLTGCVGYVGPSGGGAVVVGPPVPDVTIWGGDYYGGHDAHFYGHRGYESRHWH